MRTHVTCLVLSWLCCSEFQNEYTAQAFVFCDKPVDADLIVVAFRGTRPLDVARWRADLDPSWYKIPRLGRAHAAYTRALGAQRNIGWPKWVEHIKGKPHKVASEFSHARTLHVCTACLCGAHV